MGYKYIHLDLSRVRECLKVLQSERLQRAPVVPVLPLDALGAAGEKHNAAVRQNDCGPPGLIENLNPALQALPKGHEQHLRQSAVFSVTEYTEPDLHPLVAKVRLGFIG